MKSGKTLELIARVAPFEFAQKDILYIQSKLHVRDGGIQSRLGVNAKAQSVKSLEDITQSFDVVGVDEFHMLPSSDIKVIKQWLADGKEVIVSGLNLAAQHGRLMVMFKQLLELGPDLIITKTAVCECCHSIGAQFTQILRDDKIINDELPDIVPEDGTYVYQARCRDCFVW